MPQPKRQFTTSSLTSSLKSTFANQPLLNNLTSIDKLSSQASSLAQKAPFFGAINQQFQQHYQQQQQNQQQPYNQADGAGAASAKPKQYQQANVSANLGIGGSGSLGNPQTIANGVNEDMFRDVQANNPGSGGRPPPPPPPAVDMSHLTDEERAMIQSVMAKAEMADMGLPVDTSMPSSTNLPSNTSQALTQQRDQQQQKQQQLQQHQKRQQQQLQNNSTMVVTGVGWQGQQQSRQQMDSGNHVQVANQSLQHNQNDALAGMIQQQQQHQMTTQTEQQRLNQTNNMSPSMLDQANRAQDSMHQNQRQVSDATNRSLQLFGQQQQHNFTLNNVVNQALQDQLINQQLATNNNSNQIMREVNNFQQTSDVSSLQENNYSNYLQYNDYYQACSFDQGQQRIVPHHQSQPLNQSSTIQQIVSSPANQQQQLMAMTSFDSRDAGMQLVDSTSQYQNNRTIQAFEQASEIQQWPTTMITTSPMIKSRRGRVASARSTSSLRTIADFEHEHAYSDLDDQRAVESAVQKRNSRSNPAHFKPRRHGSTDEAESRARAKRSRNNISRDVVVGPPRAMLVGPSQFHHDSGIATISGPMSGHRKSSRRLPKAASSSLSNQSKRHVSADCSLQSSSEYLPDERGARSSDRRQELSTTRAKRMVVESVPEKSSSSSRRCKSVDSRRETSTGISRHYPNNHNHNHEQETDSEPEDISFSASDSTSDQQQQQSKPNGEASKTRQNAMVTVKGGASKLSKTGCPDYDKNQEQTLRLLSELKLNEQANQVMEQQQRLIKQSQELIKLQQAQLEQQAEINRTFRVSCLRDSGDMQEMATAKDGGPNQNDPDDKLERKEPNDLGALARLSGKETSSTLQSVSEGIKANDDDAAAAAADNDDNDDERVERSEDKDQNQKCTRDKDADLREGATDGSVTNSRWCDARGSDSSIIGLKRVDYNNSIETDYKPAVGRHKTTTTDKNADTKNSRQQASNNSGHANNSPTVSSRPVHRTSRYDRNLLQSPTDSTTDSDGDLPIAAPRSNSSSSRANRSEHHGHRQSSDQKQQSMARGLSATATTRVKREPRGLPPSPLPVTAAIQLHQMQQRHQKMNQISRPTTSSSYLSRASTHLRSSSVTSLPTTSINYHHVLFDRGDAASRLNSGYMTDDQEQRRRLGRRPISPPDSALSEYGGLVRRRKRLPEPPANVVPVTPSMVRRVVMIGQQANRTPTNALLHSQERFAPNSSSNIRSLHQLALIKPVANSYERNNTDYAGKSLFSHPTTTTTTRSDGFPSTKATTVSALSGRRSSLGYLEQSSSGLLGGLTSDSRLLSGRTFDVPSAASRLTDTDTINRSLSSLDYCNRISKSSEIRNNTTSHLDKYYNLDDGRVIAPLTYSTTNRTEPPSSTVARYNHTNFQTQQQYHPRPPPPRPSPPVIYNPLNSHSSSASTRQQQNEPVSEYPMFQHNPGQYVSDHQPRPRYQQPLASSHPATTLSHDNSYTMAPQPTPPASIASTGTRFQPYNSDGNYRARNNGYGDNSPASTRYSELMGTGHDWHAIDRSAGTIREPYLTVSPHFMSPQSAAQINTPVSLTRRISPDNDADAIASQSNLGRQTSCNNNPVSSASDSSSYNRKIYVVNDDNKQKQALKYDTNDANSQRQQNQHQQATNSISNANHNISSFACPLTKDDIINNGPKYDSIGYRFRTESQNKYVTEQRTPIECLQSKYQYPYKRILLSKNPKDRIGNGIGVRIVGGQPMQNVYDKVNKCIVTSGAFVREVFQSSRVYFMDEMHEGDQIIEWNGVNLCNRSDGEVQQILFSQFSDDEVEIIYLNRDKFFEAYGGDHEPVARFQATEQEELREIDDTFEAFSRINKPASSKVARQLGRGGFFM